MPFAVWITGLPGSGKSTIAKELINLFKKNNIKFKCLRLDKIRKKIIKKPNYTETEWYCVYKKFVDIALNYIKKNFNVIFDATANKIKYRAYARKKIKNFIEVYVKCPIDICIKRESKRKQGLVTARLYKKALERKKTGKEFKNLGQVIGIDVPYEENKNAEIIINSEKTKPRKAASVIFYYLKNKKYLD